LQFSPLASSKGYGELVHNLTDLGEGDM